MNIRLERVSRQLMKEVSAVLREEVQDPRLRGFVTVSLIHPSPDLRKAKVFYSVIGSDTDRRLTAEVLEQSAGHIQRLLARRMKMKFTPVLKFEYDTRFQEGKTEADIEYEEKDDVKPEFSAGDFLDDDEIKDLKKEE